MKIKLSEVVEAMEMTDELLLCFYDRETGKNLLLPDPYRSTEENETLAEQIESQHERYVRFPMKYEIHEYSIVEAFVDTLPAGHMQEELLNAICGKGAFRRFKQKIRYYGIEQYWYSFRADAFQSLAIQWCAEHGVEYERIEA